MKKNTVLCEKLYPIWMLPDTEKTKDMVKKSLSYEYSNVEVFNIEEIKIPYISTTDSPIIEMIEPEVAKTRMKTNIVILKAHKKISKGQPVQSWEEYRQHVLNNYDKIEQYYKEKYLWDDYTQGVDVEDEEENYHFDYYYER